MSELLWLLLPWSLAFIFLGRLRPCPPVSQDLPTPSVSMIIPARNEEKRLPPLLASLKAQDYPNFEVILVDDDSSDRTAELGEAAGCKTLRLKGPEPGWIGKPHACWSGAQAAQGEVLVFLDADTVLEPEGLKRIVATHARYGGLVSIQPYHLMERAYERLSAAFSLIMMAGIRSFTLAGERLPPNGAFGPCMVCARADYFRTGGHRLVCDEIIDDVALARALARRGVPTHNFIGQGVISFRMYPQGIGDLIEGWTKNFARGAMTTDPVMLVLIAAWVSGGMSACDALLDGVRAGDMWTPWATAGAIAYSAYAIQIHWLLHRLGQFGWLTAATYPLFLLFFMAVFARSLYLTLIRNRVAWKGRSIPVRATG
ncbi:glycosyltransferase family 2 protein [Caldichromatium japonicum]|uniref:Glycosyltransferase family 2 protein n=1 Tax=Caldichromatium japonicum TaxID=2699430 RepID=A0A6G7VBM4_9GAMM|nr:glycosyltransferase [Caldichromatium japonicum]QIK37374.1 glycosyltransferase family 2 protein [Caldichromatium japonicum]